MSSLLLISSLVKLMSPVKAGEAGLGVTLPLTGVALEGGLVDFLPELREM